MSHLFIYSSKQFSAMNAQKLLFGTLAATILIFILDWVFYGMLMMDSFTRVEGYHREMPDWLWLIIGLVVFSAVFTYMYGKGADNSGTRTQQGMRYGVLIGLLVGIGLNLIWYSLQMAAPLTEFLIDGVYTIVKLAIAGIVVAHVTGIPSALRGKASGGGGDVGTDGED
jgi:hypothetical protein